MSLFKSEAVAWAFFMEGLGINKKQFVIKKIAVNFLNFWSSKPCIRIRIWIRTRNEKKCWIRIRIQNQFGSTTLKKFTYYDIT
jgi:hypothetical protein